MSSSTAHQKRKFDLANALPYFFSLLMLSVIGYLLSPPHLALKDLPEFYAAGRMLLDGTPADLYKTQALQSFEHRLFPEHEAPILYIPPYGLPLLAPIGFLPVALADPIWFAILVLCSFAAVAFWKPTLYLQNKHIMRITAVLCLSGPEWEAIRNGQLASIMLLSLSIALFLFSREDANLLLAKTKARIFDQDALAALALTPLAAKPQLFLPILFSLAGTGRYKVILFLGAIVAVLNGVAFELYGVETFSAYFDMLRMGKENRIWQEDMTPTLRGQLLRLFPTADLSVVSLVVLVLGLICIFLIARKYRKNPYWWEYLALAVIPITLPTALHGHIYDWLLLLPTILVFVFGRVTKGLSNKQKILCLLPVIPLMMPLYNKIQYEYFLIGGSINLLFWDISAVAIVIAVWLLFRHKELTTHSSEDTANGASA